MIAATGLRTNRTSKCRREAQRGPAFGLAVRGCDDEQAIIAFWLESVNCDRRSGIADVDMDRRTERAVAEIVDE